MVGLEKYKDILLEKKIYSPGPVPQTFTVKIDFSHRSKEFEDLYKDTKEKLRKKFNIPDGYKILFVQGSGTCAIETVISSLPDLKPHVCIGGTFGERAAAIAEKYYNRWKPEGTYFYYVQFETSRSTYFDIESHRKVLSGYDIVVADCVSGFGFYPLPNVDIIIISSSKILGGLPALGIVLLNGKAESWIKNSGDYLSLPNYIKYDKVNQTPHTSLIPQLLSLNAAIPNTITRDQIIANCKALHSDKIQLKGEKIAPVLTIEVSDPEKWVGLFRRYNAEIYWNQVYMKDCFQISMFNYRSIQYYEFVRDVIEENL